MAAQVQPVTVKAGDLTITFELDPPFGDNPAYYAVQTDIQLELAALAFRDQLETRFGRQYTLEEARQNGAL